MIFVGLTGGIGSGKTTVAKVIETYGYPVYNSDFEAKRLMELDKDIIEGLVDCFGQQVFAEGKLNKQLLASVVFENNEKLKELNNIVHPRVLEHFREWAKNKKSELVFFESAIIFENNLENNFDFVVGVVAPRIMRIERVEQRSKMTLREIKQRIYSQMSSKKLRQKADFIVVNNEKHAIIPQVEKIIDAILLNQKVDLQNYTTIG